MIVIIGLAFACLIAIEKCVGEKQKVNNSANVVNIVVNDSTRFYKDAYGKEHAQRQQVEADLGTLKVYYRNLIDSVSKALKIKDKNIKTISTASLKNTNTVIAKIDTVLVDGKKQYPFSFSDRWIKLNGIVDTTIRLTYSLYDSIVITTYRKSTGFLGLGKSMVYVNGYSINPNTTVTGISNIKVQDEKPKKFSLGIGIGYGFNGNRFEPNIGFSLQYSLIRF